MSSKEKIKTAEEMKADARKLGMRISYGDRILVMCMAILVLLVVLQDTFDDDDMVCIPRVDWESKDRMISERRRVGLKIEHRVPLEVKVLENQEGFDYFVEMQWHSYYRTIDDPEAISRL